MESVPRVAEVLAAKALVGHVPLALFHSHFSYSWSASYVRLVEIETAVHSTIPVAVAYALWNDPSLPDYAPEEWLPNVSFQANGVAEVRELVAHALSDFEQESNTDGELPARLRSLRLVDASAVYELKGMPGGPRPAAPRESGPTHQVMWQSSGRFFFLEVHNES